MAEVYNSMYSSVRLYSQLKVDGRSYTENGLHRCTPEAIRQYGPDAAYELTLAPLLLASSGVHPETGYEFSRIKLPFGALYDTDPNEHHVWSDLIQELKSAAFMVLPLNDIAYNGLDMLCCWIDNVRILAQRGPHTNVEIDFHVDWWLTMGDRVNYGAGRILRGPQELARPDPTMPRKWEESSKKLIYTELDPLDPTMYSEAMWIILCYVDNVGGHSRLAYLFWKSGYGIQNTDPFVTYDTPTLSDIFDGDTEELLDLPAGSIQGVWLSPVAPYTPDYTRLHVNGNQTYAAFIGRGTGQYITILDVSEDGESIMTDDDRKISILDTTGNVIFNAPWGVPFKEIRLSVDVGTAGANLQIYLNDDTSAHPSFKASEGRFSSFPLPSLPVTSNSWQEYNYSGQRDYDIRMREIQKNQSAVNGIAGIGTSAIGGAVAGSMVAPGPGTVAGAIAGVVSGTVGTAVGYVSSGHFDRKTQNAVDKLMSSQTETVIAPTQGYRGIAPVMKGPGWYVLYMTRDAVSAAEISNEHTELGYLTDSYSTDCSTLVSNGGGLKIEGLEVFGAGPEVTRYIESIFARGVHIDIPSP